MLDISELSIRYGTKTVVNQLSLHVARGEALGLIGESGSGKSMTALSILGLLPPQACVSGSIRLDGQELTGLDDKALRGLRGKRIAMVFQDPMTSLNPLMTVEAQITEAMHAHGSISDADARRKACALLEEVGLPEPGQMLRRRPFELSGGQQQRVMIAMALACEPELLIADEPTTALDICTQVQVLQLLDRIRRKRGMSLLFVSHDLDAVAAMADRVAVMRHGELLECGPTTSVMRTPAHAYTRSLLAARPAPTHQPQSPRQGSWLQRTRPWAVELGDVCMAYMRRGEPPRRVVHEVSLQVDEGQALGIVGESGSGKSTIARAIMGLHPVEQGTVRVLGRDPMDSSLRMQFARDCQFVFQDTSGSLNPRRSIAQSLAEPQQIHRTGTPAEIARRSAQLLEEVGLDATLLERWPHQLSGGQRQRVVIARALATNPRLLVCDEPVSALDASVRAQVLSLIARLRRERQLTLIFIGHDLSVMQSVAERTLVLREGRVVEYGDTHTVFSAPTDAYTRTLITASNWAGDTMVQRMYDSGMALAAA